MFAPIFDPHDLHALVNDLLGAPRPPIDELVAELRRRLADRYPRHVDRDGEWVLNNAGGAMGAMTVLHASLTEYLIIFGSPIGTEGHTGRHVADDWFIILDGEQWAYTPGQLRREVYTPGQMHHLPRGVARGYKMPQQCWALEYARGWIPLMLPFGVADTLVSTFDFATLAKTFKIYASATVRQILRGKL